MNEYSTEITYESCSPYYISEAKIAMNSIDLLEERLAAIEKMLQELYYPYRNTN